MFTICSLKLNGCWEFAQEILNAQYIPAAGYSRVFKCCRHWTLLVDSQGASVSAPQLSEFDSEFPKYATYGFTSIQTKTNVSGLLCLGHKHITLLHYFAALLISGRGDVETTLRIFVNVREAGSATCTQPVPVLPILHLAGVAHSFSETSRPEEKTTCALRTILGLTPPPMHKRQHL